MEQDRPLRCNLVSSLHPGRCSRQPRSWASCAAQVLPLAQCFPEASPFLGSSLHESSLWVVFLARKESELSWIWVQISVHVPLPGDIFVFVQGEICGGHSASWVFRVLCAPRSLGRDVFPQRRLTAVRWPPGHSHSGEPGRCNHRLSRGEDVGWESFKPGLKPRHCHY